ncbi:phosphatidate cytidylyltransferase [Candidatus Pelagibacter sp.]|jgi:phosphatidate cytidylyltransferase|nr:phosphatidate cytidylyltransferase [Candidatus Pelagibacter sp.]
MNTELKKRIATSFFLLFLLIGMYFYSFVMIVSLVVIAIIIWVEFYALISKIFKKNELIHRFLRFFYKSISLLYLSLLIFFILSLESYYSNLKIYLMYSVIIAMLSDTGGLVFGKTFKGKKLTKISPNKTISGCIGSFLFSFLIIPFFYSDLMQYNFTILTLIILMVSLTTQLGDLLISYLKRKAKVKNTSNILPGHGGFLDRVDGIIFAIPIGILLFNFF